jgi:hypothetical protein
MLKVTHKVRVPFTASEYVDVVECDMLLMEVCVLLLGRSWQYGRNAMHAGRVNTYTFVHHGKQRTLKPMANDMIKSDVVLVVCKEKVHTTMSQPMMVTLQEGEHDVGSVSTHDISAMLVDDNPVVLVGDKPVEVKPLSDVRKYIVACSTLPVCVDKGVRPMIFVMIMYHCTWRRES